MSYFKAINQGTSSRNDCRNVIRYAQLSTTLWRLNRLYCFTVDAKLIFSLFQQLLISLNKQYWSKFNDIFVWIFILKFNICVYLSILFFVVSKESISRNYHMSFHFSSSRNAKAQGFWYKWIYKMMLGFYLSEVSGESLV